MKKFIYLLLAFFVVISCSTATYNTTEILVTPKPSKPKYIFYFIGDGYGVSQAHLAEIYLKARKDQYGMETLAMNTFPVQTNFTTYANDRLITGSAASGTALATGNKTTIGTISMNDDHTASYKSMGYIAKEKGMRVGIVSSVSINHATPAVFYSNQPSRNNYTEIAKELAASNFDYFAGGGFYLKKSKGMDNSSDMSGASIDEKKATILNLLQQNGYRYINSKKEFHQLKNPTKKIIAVAPRLANSKAMPYVIDQTSEDITLQEFTAKGIEILSNPNGFFMMVEGGKIDWACHANDAAATIYEVLQFDAAVKVALEFYHRHPKETLIVICADHETGGLSLGTASQKYELQIKLLAKQEVSGEWFSTIIDDYKAKHPDSWKFTDALELLQQYFGFNTSEALSLNECEINRLRRAFEVTMRGSVKDEIANDCEFYVEYGSYNPFTTEACQLIAEKAGVAFTTYGHTAQPVPLRAIGVGSEVFTGYLDNATLGKKIISLLK